MASKKSKMLIGIFILGAIGFICAAMIILGSGFFNRNTASFVLYFNSSLRGLTDGSAVYFNGVRVGQVTSMDIAAGSDNLTFKTPIIIELDKKSKVDSFSGYESSLITDMDDPGKRKILIENGLRAKLTTSSFITGLLVVDLAIVSDASPIEIASLEPYHGIPQIPTMSTGIENILTKFSALPIQDIAAETLKTLKKINGTLEEIQFAKISSELQTVMKTLDTTLIEYSAVANNLNKKMDSLLKNTNSTLSSIDGMASSVNKAAISGGAILQDNSATMQELSRTMSAVREAATSISYLARLLEEKPDALIFGKGR